MNIKRYNEYVDYDEMANYFVTYLDHILNENESKRDYDGVLKKIVRDLRLNFSLIGTFGAGIGMFAPIVSKLINNMGISTEMNIDKIVLLTVCSLSIVYLEEKKCKTANDEQVLTIDIKSMLEELKMMGLGNGIVKMVVKSFSSIKNVFNLIGKHVGSVVSGLVDMFAYSSLLIPIMNGISYITGKYDLTPETLASNLIGLSAGVGTIIAKHGISYILDKLKGKISSKKKEILDDVEIPLIQKISRVEDFDGDPINEQ